MAEGKRALFKSPEVCEIAQLQAYVLRSWESEFPGLGRPASVGSGRVYRQSDVDLVLRIKQLVFQEGLTLAGARRRLEEEQSASEPLFEDDDVPRVAVDPMGERVRSRLREVRAGLESILQLVSRDAAAVSMSELTLVSPQARPPKATGKRRRAS